MDKRGWPQTSQNREETLGHVEPDLPPQSPKVITPIFKGGCQRSGTTLLGVMPGSHKECLTIPEFHVKIEALKFQEQSENGTAPQDVLDYIKSHHGFRGRVWAEIPDLESAPQHEVGSSYKGLLEWLVTRYGQHFAKTDFRMWVDDSPRNIRNLHTLLAIFPEAKAIHIVRDGRGVAASVMRLDWGPNTIVGAAHWWLQNVSHGLAAESALGKDRIIRVKYEELITNPEAVMVGLCSWLGIDYDPEMAKGTDVKRESIVSRPKDFLLIGKEPDQTRARAWERELKHRQIEIFESRTQEFLPYLGYDLKYGLRARGISIKELIRATAVELSMGVVNGIRVAYRLRTTPFAAELNP